MDTKQWGSINTKVVREVLLSHAGIEPSMVNGEKAKLPADP
jgi:hypothetical protein